MMKKIISCSYVLLLFAIQVSAQNVGVNTPNPTSALDVNGGLRLRTETSAVSGTSVVLPANRSNHIITGAPTGNFTITLTGTVQEGQHMIITNTNIVNGTLGGQVIPAGTTTELLYVNGGWKQIGSSLAASSIAWSLNGNGGLADSVNNFFGTTNATPIRFIQAGQPSGIMNAINGNYFFGWFAGANSTEAALGNAGFGYSTLRNNNTGSWNTAMGLDALGNNKRGSYATALGHSALFADTAASFNVAIGAGALSNNQARGGNTAIGSGALGSNTATSNAPILETEGLHNTAVGRNTLGNNRRGSGGVALGYQAAFSDTAAHGIVAIGRAALFNNIGRTGNVAIGDSALYNNSIGSSPMSVRQSNRNVAIGSKVLLKNTIGGGNTGIGSTALQNNFEGEENVAIGQGTLTTNEGGDFNVAVGSNALKANVSGNDNVAIGYEALFNSINKNELVAIGKWALYSNGLDATDPVHATWNVGIGQQALFRNSIGYRNTAIGINAMYSNTGGFQNTSLGALSLSSTTNGKNNTSIGFSTLNKNFGDDNTALGANALNSNMITSGSGNVAIGSYAGFNETGSNKLFIENSFNDKDNSLIYGDFAADSLLLNAKTINKFSLNVRGNYPLEIGYGTAGKQVDAGKLCYGCFGDPVHWLGIVGGGTAALGGDRVIKLWSEGGLRIKGNALPNTDNGHSLGQSGLRWNSVWSVNGTINTSDANLKTNITTSPYGLKEVMQMNPVQYNWKTNPNNDLQIGFLAQEIQKIIPEAVVVPANGDPLGMKYDELIPVLVKAIQELKEENEQYKKRIEQLEASKK